MVVKKQFLRCEKTMEMRLMLEFMQVAIIIISDFREVNFITHPLILFYDARVKSLKPRCACTRVVLWLNDPPRYEHQKWSVSFTICEYWVEL